MEGSRGIFRMVWKGEGVSTQDVVDIPGDAVNPPCPLEDPIV